MITIDLCLLYQLALLAGMAFVVIVAIAQFAQQFAYIYKKRFRPLIIIVLI